MISPQRFHAVAILISLKNLSLNFGGLFGDFREILTTGADFAGECAHIVAMSHNITLTASAAKHLNALSQEAGHPVMLRVLVEGGGCSGFQYVLDLTDTANPDESEIAFDGATALVDEISAPLMAGSIIDYVEELVGSQFKILNPLAVASCGCGTSFSL